MIIFRNVEKYFEEKQVLNGLNLEIQDGETLTILGPSGSGKTVILKLMIGVLKPDNGEIIIDSQNIIYFNTLKFMRLRKKIGFVFQLGALLDSMTVGENIGLFLQMHTKLCKQEIQQKIRQSLEMVDLHDVENLRPEELSGGMLKRAAIARAIAIQPKYLLYDEPTTGLDPKTCQTINNLIIRMQKKLKVTSVVVTHDIDSAVKVSDRIAMLYQGKIVTIERSDRIYQSNNKVIVDFLKGEIF